MFEQIRDLVAVTGMRPQDAFLNPKGYRLTIDEAFCNFKIDAPRASGVYAWLVDGEVAYIGRAANLHNRLAIQYGRVSPRHPYAGGQIQKCRVNAMLNAALVAGSTVQITWTETPDYIEAERQLLATQRPRWNLK